MLYHTKKVEKMTKSQKRGLATTVQPEPKIAKMAIFAGFCAINSTKMKNSKIRSGQVFWTIERYLCANFQVKRSNGEGGVAI